MGIINSILEFLVSVLDSLLPVLGLTPAFIASIDTFLSFVIGLIQGAGWFLPLDIMVMCLIAMLAVDNFAIFMRVGQWIIKFIRG